jgi:elongation factor Ts
MNLIEKIKKLREETEISISECKRALEEAKGDLEKAKEILKKRYGELAKKKKGKEVKEGIVEAYIHPGKKIGVLLELRCESDFVANNPEFQKLAHELCLQIAAIDPEEIPLLEQNWIRDESKKIKDLISEYIAKFDENIVIEKFARFQIK